MEIAAMDKSFNLVTINIPYTNLQWTRRYYEAGEFEVVVPKTVYDDEWYYIYSADRPEVGVIEKITNGDDEDVRLSGFFAEKMLDDKTCWPWYKGTFSTVEAAARDIFQTYKDDLAVVLGDANNPMIGTKSVHDFSDDELGKKLYAVLTPFEASYSVKYDYNTAQLKFTVWQGLDRTQDQTINAPKTFSTDFGNIASKSLNIDDSDYKNFAIAPFDSNDEGRELGYFFIDMSNGGYKKEIVYNFRGRKPNIDDPYEDIEALKQEVTERLFERQKIQEIDISVTGEDYMIDYDLGDKCDVILDDLGISLTARIVEVYEVFKPDGNSITIGLGNKRITNMQRAVQG